ncbi:ABC transporter permease [Frateuria aurantia]
MVLHDLYLAWRALRRSPRLSLLMITAIGMGVGACMTQLSVWHALSGDPLPGRSGYLFSPYLDARPMHDDTPGDPAAAVNLSWLDSQNLLQQHRAVRQAAMAGGQLLVSPPAQPQQPFFVSGRYTTADFFPMFGVPLAEGHGWDAADDTQHARVVVVDQALARQLFPHGSAISRTLRLKNTDFRVIGVIHDWHPEPLFYGDIDGHHYGHPDQLFIPLSTAVELQFSTSNRLSCWGAGGDDLRRDGCIWLQYWVQLDTPAQRSDYLNYLQAYWNQQLSAGRFYRPARAHIDALVPWLAAQKLIPADLPVQLALTFGFLVVCLLNIVGLLLTRFMADRHEIGIRRALGACQTDIFVQLGCEAALIGAGGAALGVLSSQLGLWLLRQRPDDYAHMAHMDVPMLLTTIGLAVGGSLLAGALPAWRACRLPPALEIRAA